MKKWLARTAVCASVAIAIGCGGGGGEVTRDFFLRFTNNVVDLPGGVDVFMDQEPFALGLGYGASTPTYQNLTTEKDLHFFDLYRAGTQNLVDAWAEIPRADQSHHLVAIGAASPGPQQPAARILAVTVNRIRPTGTNARLLVVNAFVREPGKATPKVDLLRSGKIEPEIAELEFAKAGEFLLAAGTYDFEVRIAGLQSGTLFTKTGVTIEAGKIYFVLIRGLEGAAGVFAPDIQFIEEPPL
ncbi:MAG: hypothetical protein KatS3mg015_2698 [Fimbriimonadales bacterium]|nr:MAG: hypothetical protein KatS3mg015_2698 [Fimbriimonadales bacterium]